VKKLCLLPLTAILLFASCGFVPRGESESDKIKTMSEEIIRCFAEKDKDALYNLFCKRSRGDSALADKIEEAFGYCDCDVYIWSEIDEFASGERARSYWDVSPEIPYFEILTRVSGNDYETRYYGINYYYMIENEDDSLEGLQYIHIRLLNVDSFTIGEYIDR